MTETVRKTLVGLTELRDIDRELERLRRRCRECPALIEKHRRELEEEGQDVAARAAAIAAAKLETRRLESELKSSEDALAKLSGQLLAVKTNQEYAAAQHQIERKKAEKGDFETRILQNLDRLESLEKELRAAAAEQKTRENEFAELKASLESDLQAYMREAEDFEERRSSMLYGLDPEALKAYERVRSALEGDAIVPVENRICSGCYMSITSNDFVRICAMKEIMTCRSCLRILFLPEYLKAQG